MKIQGLLIVFAALAMVGFSAAAQDKPVAPIPDPAATAASASPSISGGGLVFLELFSAESCPFCPQAERNFGDFMQDPDVIGFTCMVDYFESGPHNRYAQKFCTAQQDLYVRMMKTGTRYTPQLVVNGTTQMAGQELQTVVNAIRAARAGDARPVRLDISRGTEAGAFDVVLPEMKRDAAEERFVLRIIGLKRQPEAAAIESHVISRSQPPVNLATGLFEGGLWNGEKTVWSAKPVLSPGTDAVIVMVQERDSGHVLAAGRMEIEAVVAAP